MKLVIINIAARTKRIIAVVPEISWVKYNTTIAIAIKIRNTRSRIPMFFLITVFTVLLMSKLKLLLSNMGD